MTCSLKQGSQTLTANRLATSSSTTGCEAALHCPSNI